MATTSLSTTYNALKPDEFKSALSNYIVSVHGQQVPSTAPNFGVVLESVGKREMHRTVTGNSLPDLLDRTVDVLTGICAQHDLGPADVPVALSVAIERH
jgi:hypothetical protein